MKNVGVRGQDNTDVSSCAYLRLARGFYRNDIDKTPERVSIGMHMSRAYVYSCNRSRGAFTLNVLQFDHYVSLLKHRPEIKTVKSKTFYCNTLYIYTLILFTTFLMYVMACSK